MFKIFFKTRTTNQPLFSQRTVIWKLARVVQAGSPQIAAGNEDGVSATSSRFEVVSCFLRKRESHRGLTLTLGCSGIDGPPLFSHVDI